MYLTISTTHQPATDLGYLLHKHPGKAQTFELAFGNAHVFYPEATLERCTVALAVDVDPVGLVRRDDNAWSLQQYVNDRPYAASSMLAVAIAQVFGTALAGNCRDKPELAAALLPLEARIPAIFSRPDSDLIQRLFEPLGYTTHIERPPLDDNFPEWGLSPFVQLHITGLVRLTDLLSHLYVLIPAIDGEKHYWVGEAEVEKLLRHGEGWLAVHPERELISSRFLRRQKRLSDLALSRLIADTGEDDPDGVQAAHDLEEEDAERPISLHDQRLGAVMAALRNAGAQRVLDLGCGEGRLLRLLIQDRMFTEVVGMDVSSVVLSHAAERLNLDRMPENQRHRLKLIHGSLLYRDDRLSGYDAAAIVEVIEHLDPPRLAAFERVVFECARPGSVVITTPNSEYNVKWPTLPVGNFRHRDHRFEWTRAEFEAWCLSISGRFGYTCRTLPIGPLDPECGAPTQMAIFSRQQAEVAS